MKIVKGVVNKNVINENCEIIFTDEFSNFKTLESIKNNAYE